MTEYIPYILFTVVTNAAAQVILKHGLNGIGARGRPAGGVIAVAIPIVTNPVVLLGFATFFVSLASHLFVLSRVDVSFAYPFLSIAYVLVAVYAHYYLAERLTPRHLGGIALVVLGTVLISAGA